MKGKICDWRDDKGFGFILSENQKVFFHISDVKTKQRRPKADDFVNFEVIQDTRRRLKAKNIVIEELSSDRKNRMNYSDVEPHKKTILDYIAIIILFFSVGAGVFIFYQTQNLNKQLVLFGISTIVATIFLSRQRKPKEKHFTCMRCKIVAEFDKRTIQAWSRGMDKLYCSACHQQWLSTQPEQTVQSRESEHTVQNRGGASGCLGLFVVIALLPALTFISVYHWLS